MEMLTAVEPVSLDLAAIRRPRNAVNSLRLDATVEQAIACIDRSGRVSLALLVSEDEKLINTLTDGDIRRGLLAGVKLTDRVDTLLKIKAATPHPTPVYAPQWLDDQMLLEMMKKHAVRQIPLVDGEMRVVDVVTLSDLLADHPRRLQAVVMAGGFGTRLWPLTENMPKPMLPVGGRPLMELIIGQLRQAGISKINVTTHFQAEKIVEYFGDGRKFGVDIAYVNESSPLGTCGALRLMPQPEEPVLVINGDILTDIDFAAMHQFHQEHRAKMTLAVRRYEVQVPYGVVESDGARLTGLVEKPTLSFFVNAGIYLLESDVYQYLNEGPMNMTELIDTLLRAGETVANFPVREYWLDIGQHADYEKAQVDALSGRWGVTTSA